MKINELVNLEFDLDNINGNYGNKNSFCIFCKVKKYNSKIGIIHNTDCIILELRNLIKFANKKTIK